MQNRLLFGAERKFDGSYFAVALLLTVAGIALIFSARYTSDVTTPYYLRQIAWLTLSLGLFFVVIRIPLRFYEVFAYPLFALSIVLLIAVLFKGRGAGGAVRWFDLGPLHFQPSEWAKLAAVVAGARFLSATHRTSPWVKLLVLAAICGVPALLVLKEPDLGTALVFCAIFLGMVAWANIPAWILALLITPFISIVAASDVAAPPTPPETSDPTVWLIFFTLLILALVVTRPGFWPSVWMVLVNLAAGVAAPLLWNRLHDYQQMRVLIFLDPSRDPQGGGYQIIQSKVAIGAGGIFGKGFLAGSQTHLKFLPAQHTDFVFAVLGEEFGLLGATLILLLLAILVIRGFWFAQKTRNRFGSYLAVGISSIILFHVLVNVGMTLGMFPVTGLPLPFLSYGGSALLAMWTNIAIMLVVAERWQEY